MIPNIVLSYFVELIYLGWIDLADSIARIDGLNDMGRCVFKLSGKKKSGVILIMKEARKILAISRVESS